MKAQLIHLLLLRRPFRRITFYIIDIFILFTMLSASCCRRDDTSPLSEKINEYAKDNCLKKDQCLIPEGVYFADSDYDHIVVMEYVYELSDVTRQGIDLNGVDLYGKEGTLKTYRIWLLLKGNKLVRQYKEQDLMMCNIPYPLGIYRKEQESKNNEPWVFSIAKGKDRLYAKLYRNESKEYGVSIYKEKIK